MRTFILSLILICTYGLYAQNDTVNFEIPSVKIDIDSSNVNNIWQIGKPSKTVFDSAFSIPKAIVTDTANPYPVNNISRFTYGFEIAGLGPNIEFKHRYNTDSLHDGGFIEISKDSGSTWKLLNDTTDLFSYYGAYGITTSGLYSSTDSLSGGHIGFSGNSGGWITSRIIFPCYALKNPFMFMLRFTFISDSIDNSKDGWMIDNIAIYNNSDDCSGLNENILSKFKCYPNPFSSKVHIELRPGISLKKGSFKIYDIQGRQVKEVKNIRGNNFEISRGRLLPGPYILMILEDGVPVSSGHIFTK